MTLPTVAAACATLPAFAEGAVAVAEPQDIVQSGWAIGFTFDYRSRAEAEQGALQGCRTAQDASEETRKLCRIVANFRDRCVAVSKVVLTDSADHERTRGFAWALNNSRAAAQRDAIAKCVATAGERTLILGSPASPGSAGPSTSGSSSDGRSNTGPRTVTQARGQFCKVVLEGCDGRAR